MIPRSSVTRLRPLLVALAVAAPAATAFAVGDDPVAPAIPSTSPTRVIAEQPGTARGIVPFGAAIDDGRALTFAVGQTRGPAPELAVAPSTPRLVGLHDEEDPLTTTPEPPVVDEDDLEAERGQATSPPPPAPSTPWTPSTPSTTPPSTPPPASVLLQGVTRGADAPTAWARTATPLDAEGTPLAAGTWRPAGATPATASAPLGTASPHAGEATPKGAAALLVTRTPSGGDPETSEVLVRTTGGGFRLLPAPPAALLAPATRLSAPDAQAKLAPLAVFDVAAPTGSGPPPAYGRTGVLIAPPEGDGVLVWNGTAWSEEPFLDADGRPAPPARSAEALAATPDGDGVALFTAAGAGSGTSGTATLMRRSHGGTGWRPLTVDAPLLSGPLPPGVSVTVVERPGDPLTVAPGHWWIDLQVTANRTKYATTVHLTPGPAPTAQSEPPGDVPPSTAPPTDPSATDPAATTPPTDPDPASTTPTTPDPTSTDPGPTSTGPTTPPLTTPTSPWVALGTHTWCEATSTVGKVVLGLAKELCDEEYPARFPRERGYRSVAFAAPGAVPDGAAPSTPSPAAPWGGRVITSPVVGLAEEKASAGDGSAGGGYLRLDGSRFTLHGGIGETPAADNLTEAAAFVSDRLGWTGGRRVLGHVTRATAQDASLFAGTSPLSYEPIVDVALTPDVVAAQSGAGAIMLSAGAVRRVYDDGRRSLATDSLVPISDREGRRLPRAIAWALPDMLVTVGTDGLLATLTPPNEENSRESSYQPAEIRRGAEGIDLTDVAFTEIEPGSEEEMLQRIDGWAVGREGKALHFFGEDMERVDLAPPLSTADLRQVAYAGRTAYVASSRGLLVAAAAPRDRPTKQTLIPDEDLARLIKDDGRPPGISTVAGLPDGAVVVDGRYAKASAASPWERLRSPIEGDVVALSVSRPIGAAPGVDGLQIHASIADSPRPRSGEKRNLGFSRGPEAPLNEEPVLAFDGRLSELTPDGWVDRARTPLDLGTQLDLPAPPIVTQAVASGPLGGGWAGSGVGSSGGLYATEEDFDTVIQGSRGVASPLTLASPVADLAGRARVGREASGGKPSAVRAQTTPDPTTVTTPSTPTSSTSPTTPTTPASSEIEPAGPGAAPIRILIGGHPACLTVCTSREDQRIAPTETLRRALATAARLRQAGGSSAPRAVVIGGGRTARGAFLFDRAAATSYADLLRSEPDAPPVFPALGTGDQWLEESRASFVDDVIEPLEPERADGVVPVTDPAPPADSGAYAFDVPGTEGGAARIVVADTTDVPSEANDKPEGTSRDWTAGPHGQWLDEILSDAKAKGRPSVVIGASPLRLPEQNAIAQFLAARDVMAYVSTDGVDDPYDLASGPRERRFTLGEGAQELLIIHTAALGHALLTPTINRNRSEFDALDWFEGPLADLSDPSMVELSIPPERASLRRVVPRSVPVFREFATPELRPVPVGQASFVNLSATIDSDNGIRYVDPNNSGVGPVPSWGYGVTDVTPYPCRLWFGPQDCGTQIDSVGQFSVADPTIAEFVRARVNPRQSDSPPEVVSDASGNPVRDPASPVLCPLKPGTTTATATVAGRSVTMQVRVLERTEDAKAQKAKCAFNWATGTSSPDPEPKRPAQPAVEPPITAPVPPAPTPPTKAPNPSKPLVEATPVRPVGPLVVVPLLAMQPPAGPTVAPNPKPISNPPTPSPPAGVNSHSWNPVPSPATHVQIATAMQEQRREQLARESAEHYATVYRADPHSPLAPAIAGGTLLVLLVGTAGHVAGRRRALSRAAQRSWIA